MVKRLNFSTTKQIVYWLLQKTFQSFFKSKRMLLKRRCNAIASLLTFKSVSSLAFVINVITVNWRPVRHWIGLPKSIIINPSEKRCVSGSFAKKASPAIRKCFEACGYTATPYLTAKKRVPYRYLIT